MMIYKKEIIVALTVAFILTGCGGSGNEKEIGNVTVPPPAGNTDSTSVSVDNGNENDNDRTPLKNPAVETKPTNWYVRLTAEDPARGMKTASTQLGELEEDDVVQKHTLKALTPFDSSYLDIVFRDPGGVDAGDYKSNFHRYSEGVEDSWQFTVRTDDPDADILLSWRGLYVLTPYMDDQGRQRYKEYRSVTNPLIQNMKLVDVSSGKEIAAAVDGKVQTYVFNMDGQNERTFEWIVQTDVVDISVDNSKFSTLQAIVLKKDAAVQAKSITEKKAETFDLSKPPMIKEEMHGKQ